MQLMQGVVPSLQALSREGEYGRNKITQYTRYLTVPMAILQAYGFLALLNRRRRRSTGTFGLASFETLTQIVDADRRLIALMWIGELITERGIGNGISFIIFAGIVSRAPGAIGAFLAAPNIALFVAFGVVADRRGRRRSSTSRKASAASRSSTPAASAAGACTRAARRSCPCASTRPASSRSSSRSASCCSRSSWRRTSRRPRSSIVADDRQRDRHAVQPEVDPVHRAVLPADGRLHVLLHGLHVQAGRDRRAAAQERRLHPGHPTGSPDPGLPGPGRQPDHLRRRHVPGASSPCRRRCSAWSSRISARIGLGGTSLLIVVSVVVETMKQIEAQLMMRNYEGFIR